VIAAVTLMTISLSWLLLPPSALPGSCASSDHRLATKRTSWRDRDGDRRAARPHVPKFARCSRSSSASERTHLRGPAAPELDDTLALAIVGGGVGSGRLAIGSPQLRRLISRPGQRTEDPVEAVPGLGRGSRRGPDGGDTHPEQRILAGDRW
jgi:hypothetical protein